HLWLIQRSSRTILWGRPCRSAASRPLMTSLCPALMTFLDCTMDSVVCTRGGAGAALAGPANASTVAAASTTPARVRVRDLRILLLHIQASSHRGIGYEGESGAGPLFVTQRRGD